MNGDETRPDPDALLGFVRAEERRRGRGKLKVFLGYAAGVGKTYAMLDAARQRQAQGVDVVVAYVETHGRAETQALLQGLEVIPRRQVNYRGTTLPEMDIDRVLARRPQLVLVDELAHSNAPGSRHPKRYQDVEELLGLGIDVYTTLNIQHIESLNDVVAQITGVRVRETVPDRILDEAEEIEVVDLPPHELRQRLAEGKVYVPDQAARAMEGFFREGNLTALREMALRRAAQRVDEEMRAYMQTRAIPGPWPATERLLVCISPSMLGERLVRAARRLATRLHAEWIALYVETPAHARLAQAQRDRVARTLQLAEELGARAVMLPGDPPDRAVIEYARTHNVTAIIAGKPLRPRWLELLRGSFVDRLIRQSGAIDVYVVSSAPDKPAREPSAKRPLQSWRAYLSSAAIVAAATLIGYLVNPFIALPNLVMLYLLAVVVAALRCGRGPAIVTALLGVLAFDFFLVPPRLSLAASDKEYVLTFAGLAVVGLVISALAARARDQAQVAQRRQVQTSALYSLSRDLVRAGELTAIVQAITDHVAETFGREVAVLLPSENGLTPAAPPGFDLDANEIAVATWAFEHAQPAGRGTDTLPASGARYLPLITPHKVVGVLGVKPPAQGARLTPEQTRLLEAFAGQAALAIERAQLAEEAQRAQLLEATEKLHTALLNSISHDLRTPLASIAGSLSSLRDDDAILTDEERRSLVRTAWEETQKLNHLVGSLLDMTRLEAGAMQPRRQLCDMQETIGAAVGQFSDALSGRNLTIDAPDTLPLVPMDPVAIVRVLFNLLDNAIKYSPPGSPIEIRATSNGSEVTVSVADRGIGIPAHDLVRIFDKFYRVRRPGTPGGTGLGLSISKGIVEAHGGRIWAENRPGGGAVVSFTLPLTVGEQVGGAEER